jgi:hypothetical protein
MDSFTYQMIASRIADMDRTARAAAADARRAPRDRSDRKRRVTKPLTPQERNPILVPAVTRHA